MLFTVTYVVKNEEINIDRMYKDMKPFMEAKGEVIILDTGSTDKTKEKARGYGFNLIESPIDFNVRLSAGKYSTILSFLDEKDAIYSNLKSIVSETYFNFSRARNYIHKLVKTKMVLQLDASHHIQHFDFQAINNFIKKDKIDTFQYRSLYSTASSIESAAINDIRRFYNIKKGKWVRYVHEVLITEPDCKVKILEENILSMRHIKNENKIRNYLAGLFDDFICNEDVGRCVYYLARELFYIHQYHSSMKIFKLYLKLPETWDAETCAVLWHVGDCNRFLGTIEEAEKYYLKSVDAYDGMREPYFKLIDLYKETNNYKKALEYELLACKIERRGVFVESSSNYTYRVFASIQNTCLNLYLETKDTKYLKMGASNLEKTYVYTQIYKSDTYKLILGLDAMLGGKALGVVYVGQSSMSSNNLYCRELYCLNLAKKLSNSKEAYIVVQSTSNNYIKWVNEVLCMSAGILRTLTDKYTVNKVIVVSFASYFLEMHIECKSLEYHMYDGCAISNYGNGALPEVGKGLIYSVSNNIQVSGFTSWHVNNIVKLYPFLEDNVALRDPIVNTIEILEKIPYSFVSVTYNRKCLQKLLKIFEFISTLEPRATLKVYHSSEPVGFNEKGNIEYCKDEDWEKGLGCSMYMLAPLELTNTYCNSFLEAMISKTLIITTEVYSGKETFQKEICGANAIYIPESIVNDDKAIASFTLSKIKEDNTEIIDSGYQHATQYTIKT